MADANSSPPRRSPRGRPQKPLSIAERAERALRELRAIAREIGAGQGIDPRELETSLGELTLPITVELGGNTVPRENIDKLAGDFHLRVDEMLKAAIAFRTGHVYCFLCDRPDCPHTQPSQRDETFAGYTPTGRPTWTTFTNLCLELAVDRVDLIYAERPEIIAIAQADTALKEGMLPGFGGDSLAYNMLGQVVAGLIPMDLNVERRSDVQRVALTIQLVETRCGRATRRLRANLLGLTTTEVQDAAASGYARGPAEKLRRVLRATDHRLNDLGRKAFNHERRGQKLNLSEAVRPVLSTLRGDLERIFRPVRRRTQHAQERHLSGERPTSIAMQDAAGAADESHLEDTQHKTIVVLGRRGRAHVFALNGRHVTSFRLRSGELEHKLDKGRWRHLSAAQIVELRRLIQQSQPEDAE